MISDLENVYDHDAYMYSIVRTNNIIWIIANKRHLPVSKAIWTIVSVLCFENKDHPRKNEMEYFKNIRCLAKPYCKPSKHYTLTKCCFNADPASMTLAQHRNSIGLDAGSRRSFIRWDIICHCWKGLEVNGDDSKMIRVPRRGLLHQRNAE